jgi:hypothetical protein
MQIFLARTAVTILTSTLIFQIVTFCAHNVLAFRMDHKISINYILCSKALSMCTGTVGCFLLGRNVILNILQIRSERVEPLGCMKFEFKCVKLTIHNSCLIIQNERDMKSSWRFKDYLKKN